MTHPTAPVPYSMLSTPLNATEPAQEVIHAVTGTVLVASSTDNTFSLKTEDGSITLFAATAMKKTSITFSKEVKAQTVAVNSFHTVGAHVLVFYYGVGNVKTAVALRNLGLDPSMRVTESVKGFDKHRHAMTVDGNSPAPVDLLLSGDTVIDTPNGVMEVLKYHPNKGARVGALVRSSRGTQTAIFISATGPNASMS